MELVVLSVSHITAADDPHVLDVTGVACLLSRACRTHAHILICRKRYSQYLSNFTPTIRWVMIDGTIEGLRTAAENGGVQLFLDGHRREFYGQLTRVGETWCVGSLRLETDHLESKNGLLVLRKNDTHRVKYVIPQMDGNITEKGIRLNIAHIAPVYIEDTRISPPRNLVYKFSLFVFSLPPLTHPVSGHYVA